MAGTGSVHLRDGAILSVRDLHVEYQGKRRGQTVSAVAGVSLDVMAGETIGIVGESGCGKSSLGRAILQIPPPTSGSVLFRGRELTETTGEELRSMRSDLQMIFQDPISSINPRRTVANVVGEGLDVHGMTADRKERIDRALSEVGLDPLVVSERRAVHFSGGQCQRIAIARALAMEPSMIVCDEPVSALDVSIQAQILNLLADLRQERSLSLIFISHDLGVVQQISDRVMVMYLGKVCEVASAQNVFGVATHPYTKVLVDAIPLPDPRIEAKGISVVGEMPSPTAPPSGCRFHTRCTFAQDVCQQVEPTLRAIGDDHYVACHFADDMTVGVDIGRRSVDVPPSS
jgi:peptide/nickel transport system ATP-binding protein